MTEETDGTGAPRKKHPGGGKKGRRRKGHKKKIKRIKPAAGSSSDSSWDSNAPAGEEGQRWREEQINSSLTSVTKLSLNESERQQKQNQKPGRKKHRQKSSLQPTVGGGSKRKTTTTKKSSIRSGRRDENWARNAGQELIVLNSDDIYDGNMQITVQRDAATVEGDEAGGVKEMVNLSDEGDSWRQHQKDQLQRKLTPAERRQKKLEKQRKQLKKFKKGRWNSFSSRVGCFDLVHDFFFAFALLLVQWDREINRQAVNEKDQGETMLSQLSILQV